jgi:hypothetical protein
VLADIDLSGPSALTLVALTNDAFALLDSAVVEFSRQLPKASDRAQSCNTTYLGIRTSTILVDGFVQTLRAAMK